MDFSLRNSSLTPERLSLTPELSKTPQLQEKQESSDGAKPPLTRLRRANAHPDISQLHPNIPSENMPMTLRPEKRQTISSPTLKLISQAQELFDQAQYHQARDVLMLIKKKDASVLMRLREINRLIRAEKPKEEDKPKKTLEEKLQNNLRLAREQQAMELPKCLNVFQGNIPEAIDVYHDNLALIGASKVGIAYCKGRRATMEDRHLATEFPFVVQGEIINGQLYAVFDGHGGTRTVTFVKDNLPFFLKTSLEKHNHAGLTKEGIASALRECFLQLDDACIGFRDGTTASVAFLLDDRVWAANTGDSRIILCDQGLPVQLSQDAKLDNDRFLRKITKLRGRIIFVEGADRVEGIVNVGGSLGDGYILGEEGDCCVPAQPQISEYPIEKGKGFLLLASDGFFDVASTNQAIEEAQKLIQTNESAQDIAKRLVLSALISRSKDNVTVIFVAY